ncbi:serine hydrolase domain-containing protein [Sinorhizobium fredii]|uniref:serine hydrolase domain-containing protein n=1 Tax=Rhizobium fredii TaxID=380 RepID=UPI003394245E
MRYLLTRVAAALLLFLSPADLSASRNETVHAPPVASALPEGRKIGDIEFECKEGFSSRCRISDFMRYARICALLVVKSGKIRFQKYNDDPEICEDDKGEPNGPDRRYGIASVTKSITSTLLGHAIATRYGARTREQFERVLDRPIGDYIGELRRGIPSAYSNVPLDNVLRMRSGVWWTEYGWHGFFSGAELFRSKVREGLMESIPTFAHRFVFASTAGPHFNYSALDAAVASATAESLLDDRSLLQFMEKGLWASIGAEADASWGVDKAGTAIGPCCLRATVRDLARFGLLVLRKGRDGQGNQVIPRAWFEIATKRLGEEDAIPDGNRSQNAGCPLDYRYYWWLRQNRTDFTAVGRDGQFVHVYPESDTVIVQISDWKAWTNGDALECETFRAHDALEAAVR